MHTHIHRRVHMYTHNSLGFSQHRVACLLYVAKVGFELQILPASTSGVAILYTVPTKTNLLDMTEMWLSGRLLAYQAGNSEFSDSKTPSLPFPRSSQSSEGELVSHASLRSQKNITDMKICLGYKIHSWIGKIGLLNIKEKVRAKQQKYTTKGEK